MPGAVIAIDQARPTGGPSYGSPGVARNDLWLGQLVSCRATTSGNTSFAWSFLDVPAGSAATLSGASTGTATFTPDVVGSYRVQLITNGGGPGNIQILVAAIRYNSAGTLAHRGWRIPALGEVQAEDNFAGQMRGWSEAFEFIFGDLLDIADSFTGGGFTTTLTADFHMPAPGTTTTAYVGLTTGLSPSNVIGIAGLGGLIVETVNSNSLVVLNPNPAPTGNASTGTVAAAGAAVTASGPIGPQGGTGSPGAAGTPGTNGNPGYGITTSAFTMPAVGATNNVTVNSTGWLAGVGQNLAMGGAGTLLVTAVTGSTLTLQNTGTPGNLTPTTVVGAGAALNAIGPQGASGGGIWVTDADIDFTALPPQTFTTDGTYSLAGLTVTKGNSANEVTHAFIDSTGLNFTPSSTGDYNGGTRTLPFLQWTMNSFFPNLDLDTPVRITAYVSSFNGAANYDNAVIAVDVPGASGTLGVAHKRGYGPSGIGQATNVTITGGTGGTSDNYTIGTPNNVMVMELPNGVAAGVVRTYHGSYSGGLPAFSALTTNSRYTPAGAHGTQGTTANQLCLLVGAQRAGSGTTGFLTRFGRLKVEHYQTASLLQALPVYSTTLSGSFTVPLPGATAVASVLATAGAVANGTVTLNGAGTFVVSAVLSATSLLLLNPLPALSANVTSGTTIAAGNSLTTSGPTGAAGAPGPAAPVPSATWSPADFVATNSSAITETGNHETHGGVLLPLRSGDVVTGVRVFNPSARTVQVKLWNSGGSVVAVGTGPCLPGAWTTIFFSSVYTILEADIGKALTFGAYITGATAGVAVSTTFTPPLTFSVPIHIGPGMSLSDFPRSVGSGDALPGTVSTSEWYAVEPVFQSQSNLAVAIPAPTLHWGLDEASGASSYLSTGTLSLPLSTVTGAAIVRRDGVSDGAADFRGTGALSSGPTSVGEATTQITASVWFYVRTYTGPNVGGASTELLLKNYHTASWASPFGALSLQLDSGNAGGWQVTCTVGGTSYSVAVASSTADKILLDRWYNMALTFDGSTGPNGVLTAYLNGEPIGTTTTPLAGIDWGAHGAWNVGGNDMNGSYQQLDGLLDEVQVWPTALSAAVMRQVFNSGRQKFSALQTAPKVLRGPAASRPTPGLLGSLFLATDVPALYFDDGTAWQQHGPVAALAGPGPVSNWTAVGPIGLKQKGDSLLALSVAAAFGAALQPIPASFTGQPFAVEVFCSDMSVGSYPGPGVVIANGVTSGVSTALVGYRYSGGSSSGWGFDSVTLGTQTRSAYFSSNGNDEGTHGFGYWMRLLYDGSLLHFQVSAEGQYWSERYSLALPGGYGYFGFAVANDYSSGVAAALFQQCRLRTPIQYSATATGTGGTNSVINVPAGHGLVPGMAVTVAGLTGITPGVPCLVTAVTVTSITVTTTGGTSAGACIVTNISE